MQFLKYIQYFFYLAHNWNFGIAWHIIKHETTGEKKYGIDSTGADELRHLEKKGIDIQHATIYMPASYDLLEKIFEQVHISSFKHFIDIGCGKGRVMCVAANFGVAKMTGIDLSKQLAVAASENLAKTKLRFPSLEYHVINNDAFYYDIPKDVDCIFLFNPFDEVIMNAVVKNIKKSIKANPRKMTIIYLNPLHKHLFTEAGYKQVFHTKKINYLEASILTREA